MAEKTRVLIVDDAVLFGKSLSAILAEKGYEVIAVNSGEEALGKIKERFFDVVLMDIKMPVMDGLDTYKRMKKITPQTPVIMMTAYSIEELINNALKEGVYGVVYKPFDIEKIVEMIEAAKMKVVLIMVVDDDPHTCQTLKDILEEKKHVLVLAKNGEEAIKIAREKPLDILFIDMKLPLLNGLETYLAIRKINPKVVTIIITAYRQEMNDLIKQALSKGAYCCIYKPFDPKEVLDIVEEIVKGRKVKSMSEEGC